MIYNIRKLQGSNEVREFKRLLDMYKGFDKMDVLLDLLIQNLNIGREVFNARVFYIKKEESYIKINIPPQEIQFCDGDKCEIPILINLKC